MSVAACIAYPELSEEDQEAIRQRAVAAINIVQGAKSLISDPATSGSTVPTANTALIDGVRKFALSVKELDIDLIDRINPFGEAYRQSKVQQHCQLDHFSREVISAESFRKMSRHGYQYELNDSDVCLKEDDTKKACLDIEMIISKLGGLNVLGYIFDTLRRSNKIYRGLFLYGRQVSQMSEPRQPTIPWHFLYNLSLKNLTISPTSRDPNKDFQALISLAQDFASCLDVEEYNAFANIGLSPYAINEALQENAVYDELFSFQQWGADNKLHPPPFYHVVRANYSQANGKSS